MDADSRLVVAFGGTLAFHILLITIADIVRVTNPIAAPQPDPDPVEIVDITPLSLPVPAPLPDLVPDPAPVAVATKPVSLAHVATRPPPIDQPPPPPSNPDPGGGAPVVQMADIAPTANGVAVAVGKPHDRVGRGSGSGTGTGSGTGPGSGSGEVAPMSVATIKTKAKPRGDYGYIDAGRDYPPEARQLGIEGVIKVRLVVGVDGNVKRALLLTRLGHGLDELALARAQKIQFDPARDTDDNLVASVVIWTFNMTLPK